MDRNEEIVNVEITRHELNNILSAVYYVDCYSGKGTQTWKELANKLKEQLNAFDAKCDKETN